METIRTKDSIAKDIRTFIIVQSGLYGAGDKTVDHIIYSCNNIIKKYYVSGKDYGDRRNNIISMYRGYTDAKQMVLMDPNVEQTAKNNYINVAEVFKAELDYFLIPKKWL